MKNAIRDSSENTSNDFKNSVLKIFLFFSNENGELLRQILNFKLFSLITPKSQTKHTISLEEFKCLQHKHTT